MGCGQEPRQGTLAMGSREAITSALVSVRVLLSEHRSRHAAGVLVRRQRHVALPAGDGQKKLGALTLCEGQQQR